MSKISYILYPVGHHGVGKTELSKFLIETYNFGFIETGEMVRGLYKDREEKYSLLSIGEFVKQIEINKPGFFMNRLNILIEEQSKNHNRLIINGMRNFEYLQKIVKSTEKSIKHVILGIEGPDTNELKERCEHRDGEYLTDVDFEKKLELDRKLGVDEVLQNANFIVKNDSSLEHLYKSGSLVINQIESNFLPLSHEDILLNLFDDTLRDHRDGSIVSDIDLFEIGHRLSNLSNNDIVDLLIDVRQKSNSLELSKLTKHQALACARDLGLIMALITKIKNYDRVEVNYDYAFLGDLLVSLSKITQEVPRETVYSYGPRNNGAHKAKRTFTNLKEEEIFIDNFSIAIEGFYKVIGELLGFRKYILEDQGGTYLNNAIKEFGPAIQGIVNIRKLISPEVFTHQMRPYFDSYEVGGIRYDAPGGSQMPLIIIDLIIRGGLSADESFNKFVDRNIEYYPSALKRLALTLKNERSLIDEIVILKNRGDISDVSFQSYVNLLMSMMNVIYSFRVPHLKVAQDNFKLRESSALGSGGYNPDILEHLINLTLEARSKLSAMK